MAKQHITGRVEELANLERLINTPSSEFIAVYGRRRVGKTFLIREFFNNAFDFYTTGIANTSATQQAHEKILYW
jgi:uncharacterized protein